jgi:hypothetical protein
MASGPLRSLTLKAVQRTDDEGRELLRLQKGDQTVTRVPPFGRPLANAHVDGSAEAQREPVGRLLTHRLIRSGQVGGQGAP